MIAAESIAEQTLEAILTAEYPSAEDRLEAVCRYVDRLHELVRWFDLAYGDNEPIWLTTNLYGDELETNVRLIETYRGVIGSKQ